MILGEPNVDRMLRGMTHVQFLEWRVFAELEVFPEQRADYRAASIVSILRNINRKRGTAAKPMDDSVILFGDESKSQKKKPMDWRQMKMIGMQLAIESQIDYRGK